MQAFKLIPLPQKQSLVWQEKYLKTLTRPMDGMWQQIAQSGQFWKIKIESNEVGYCNVDAQGVLLQLFIYPSYYAKSDVIFEALLKARKISGAMVSSGDSFLLTVGLSKAKKIEENAFLFSSLNSEIPFIKQDELQAEEAKLSDHEKLVDFYVDNVGTPVDWTHNYVQNALAKNHLTLFKNDLKEMIGLGEFRGNEIQTDIVDLGVVVAKSQRGKKYASSIMAWLRKKAQDVGKTPICSCEVDNKVSFAALTRAGFVPNHKLFKLYF